MRYCLIANPHAGHGRGRAKLRRLQTQLERERLRCDWAFCQDMDQARVLSEEANRSGYDVVVAVGGDGTINRVLNGFYDPDGKRLSSARMGVVHIGTSPDFCRSYRIPTALDPAGATLTRGVVRPVSVGRIVYGGEDRASSSGGRRSAVFGCCANIGLGASVAHRANGGVRRYAGDFLGTLVSLLGVLLTYRPHTMQLTLDGEPRVLPGVYNIAVGKTFYVASGLKVRHALSDQDSRLYVVCLRNVSWLNAGRVLGALYRGRPIQSGACLSLEYARNIAVASMDRATDVEFDGDAAGVCPCRIETAPDPLDLIVGESV